MNAQEHKNLTDDLRQILGFTVLRGVRWPNVVVAQTRAHEWCAVRMPSTGEERGGSSSPVEVAERIEDRRVAAQAARDAQTLPTLREAFGAELVLAKYGGAPTRELAKVAEDLARIVARYTRPVDATELTAPAGCRACSRTIQHHKQKVGGHYAEVWGKRPSAGLCYRCYEARGRFGVLPPTMWCHLLHTEGRDKADRWLARHHPDLYAKSLAKAKAGQTMLDQTG